MRQFGFGSFVRPRSVGAQPSSPVSLYSTADMVQEFNASYSELLGAYAFRLCRDASQIGRLLISGVPSGNYRFRGTISAYDGAISGIGSLRCRIVDDWASRFDTFASGDFDVTVTISSGLLRFDSASAGFGYRLDNLLIEAA